MTTTSGMYQDLAWQLSLFGVVLIAAVYLVVLFRSGDPDDFGAVKQRLYRARPFVFAALVLTGAWALVATLSDLPYAATRGETAPEADIVVAVTGHQWYWQMDRTRFPVDATVDFRVQSADVNHGFAIYNARDEVVVQTQAMPGYVNVVRHTFRSPGTYMIRCLEYCGLAHHNMDLTITVAARDAASAEQGQPETARAPSADGATLYRRHCAACHQSNGQGVSGVFPPLAGNPAVTAQDPVRHIETILNGAQGRTIGGKTYSAPMPALGGRLSDADIAAIANHERTSWGNDAPTVTAADVAELRSAASQ